MLANDICRCGYVANNSVCMERCSLNIGACPASGGAGPTPPTLDCDWSDFQNENKYNEGGESQRLTEDFRVVLVELSDAFFFSFSLMFKRTNVFGK